ncbi:MAG: hypothetical protein QNJ94_18800 [Alphaproteobacteria bacterium]|nr:hypothetical protein [Alphaproteobacteria bacterium]
MATPERIASLLFALVLAGALLYLSIPRSVAALLALPDDRQMRQLRKDPVPELSQGELEALFNSRRAALQWTENGRAFSDLGLVQLLQAVRHSRFDGSRSATAEAWRTGAVASLETGLSVAPVNPHAWTQLAYARALSEQATADHLVRLLVMSIYTGPYEPQLVFARLKLFIDVWDYLTDEQQSVIYGQVRFAWSISRDRLVRLVAPLEQKQVNIVRVALAGNPSYFLSFERRLIWARRKLEEETSSR